MNSEEWVAGIYEGYLTKTIVFGNATIEINRPLLDAAEMAKREEQVKQALVGYGKEKWKHE